MNGTHHGAVSLVGAPVALGLRRGQRLVDVVGELPDPAPVKGDLERRASHGSRSRCATMSAARSAAATSGSPTMSAKRSVDGHRPLSESPARGRLRRERTVTQITSSRSTLVFAPPSIHPGQQVDRLDRRPSLRARAHGPRKRLTWAVRAASTGRSSSSSEPPSDPAESIGGLPVEHVAAPCATRFGPIRCRGFAEGRRDRRAWGVDATLSRVAK